VLHHCKLNIECSCVQVCTFDSVFLHVLPHSPFVFVCFAQWRIFTQIRATAAHQMNQVGPLGPFGQILIAGKSILPCKHGSKVRYNAYSVVIHSKKTDGVLF